MLSSQVSLFIARMLGMLALVAAIVCLHVPVAHAQPVAQGDEFDISSDPMPGYQTLQRTRAVSRAADGSFQRFLQARAASEYG